jgi:hypothetical protein
MKILQTLWLAGLLYSMAPLQAIELRIGSKGTEVSAEGMGGVILEPPVLVLDDGKTDKPVFEATSEKEGVAKYSDGSEVRYEIADQEIRCAYKLADGVKALRFQMILPLKLNQGGKFAFGGEDLKEFPGELGEQFVATSKNREPFTVVDAMGDGFTLEVPANWQGLQDNRKFGWQVFAYQFLYDLKAHPGKESFTILITPKKT